MREPAAPASSEQLEIKDARLIFDAVWEQLETDVGHEGLRFPKEIILLGGAPGAGKGTNTRFIMNARGFTCPPIVISDLLKTPEMEAVKNRGEMVGDREVISILLRTLLRPEFRDGAILDGFPRTMVQVECLKLLVAKINDLHREFQDTPLASQFRKPTIHAMVLFVEESTSIERQLRRGKLAEEHNAKVAERGEGVAIPIRKTDTDPEAARHRYRVFKEKTWDALESLREGFFYHFVNAEGSLEEVEKNILDELRYQSSLELDQRTFERIRIIPLASEIVVHARQELVKRLDNYEIHQPELFGKIATIIEKQFMPIIFRHAISGRAAVNTEDSILDEPNAFAMLIDVFSDRGYHAAIDKRIYKTPRHVDLKTGAVVCYDHTVYRIHIEFPGSEIRRG